MWPISTVLRVKLDLSDVNARRDTQWAQSAQRRSLVARTDKPKPTVPHSRRQVPCEMWTLWDRG
jgi:hypothetical protein